ncbi:MAG: YfiR family protein [bacterium]
MSILTVKTVRGLWPNAIIILYIILCIAHSGHAQSLTGLEYEVKAGFIYNFAKFVGWPEEAGNNDTSPLILGIVPDHPKSDVFYSLNGKSVGERKIEVKKFKTIKDKGVEECHILFFDSKNQKFIKESLLAVRKRSVLTVGHMDEFTQEGGIINFFNEEGRLRFEVNLDAAKSVGLKLGSQLLMSAEIIKEKLR